MPDPIAKLRELVEAGRITPDCDLGAAGRAREALHRIAPELLAVTEAARGLLAEAERADLHRRRRAEGGQIAGVPKMMPSTSAAIRRALEEPVRALSERAEFRRAEASR